MFESTVTLQGKNFGSVVVISIRMPKRGGLYKGEALRIVEDIADKIARRDLKCRWETYENGEATAAEFIET